MKHDYLKGRDMRIQAAFLAGKNMAELMAEFHLSRQSINEKIKPVRQFLKPEFKANWSTVRNKGGYAKKPEKIDPELIWADLNKKGLLC